MLLLMFILGVSILLLQTAQGLSPTTTTGMDAAAIASVTIPVVALTQICKWMGLPDKRGPIIVLLLAAIGIGVWALSEGALIPGNAFSLFTGWALIATSAAGVFGFTRSGPEAITSTSQPPAGAGSNPTAKLQ